MEQIQLQELEFIENDVVNSSQIIVYNDDFNTFDNVIKCLMVYCKHTYEQALQSALNIHNTGKASVKEGSKKELKPICEALLEKGLSATIE